MRAAALLTLVVATAAAACSQPSTTLEVKDARIGQPLANTAALYLTIENNTDLSDRLIAAETPVAELTELHESETSADGIVTMNRQSGFEVGPGATLILEPGGKHIMLLAVEPLDVDDTVPITLIWEKAGPLQIEATVVPAGLAGRSDDGD